MRMGEKHSETESAERQTETRPVRRALFFLVGERAPSLLRPPGRVLHGEEALELGVWVSDLGLPVQVPCLGSLPYPLPLPRRAHPSPPSLPLSLTHARAPSHSQSACQAWPHRKRAPSTPPIQISLSSLSPKSPIQFSHTNFLSYKVGLHTALTQAHQR